MPKLSTHLSAMSHEPYEHEAVTSSTAAGYFQDAAQHTWVGIQGITPPQSPEFGPSSVHPALGVTTIGAVPWVTNFNVLLNGVSMPAGVSTFDCETTQC